MDTRTFSPHLPLPRRYLRFAVGIVALAALVAVLGWFLPRFGPAEPRRAAYPETPSVTEIVRWAGLGDDTDVVAVPFGDTLSMDGFVLGHKFTSTEAQWDEDLADLSDERRRALESEPGWRYRLGDIRITAGTTRIVDEEAFAEWYPRYRAATSYDETVFDPDDVRLVVAEVSVENGGDEPAETPWLDLASAKLAPTRDGSSPIVLADGAALSAIYGVPSEGFAVNSLPDGWNVVGPGETRTLALPFVVYRNYFADREAFDRLAPEDFSLVTYNCDPPVRYELSLG